MPARAKESYAIQSVDNALALLEALCEEGEEIRISQLSEKLGMNKTSVFRLLATFENRGYVEREKTSGKYRLGISAYEIGQKFLSRMALLRKARPVMERLVRECNEAVYLVLPRGEEVLFLELVDTLQQVKIVSLVGRRFPARAVAAGKVLLACGGRTDAPLPPAELHAIHASGCCADAGALGEGIASLAVPLFGAGGELAGSLCLVGPEFRLTAERLERELPPRLRDAGEIVSSKLGHIGQYLDR